MYKALFFSFCLLIFALNFCCCCSFSMTIFLKAHQLIDWIWSVAKSLCVTGVAHLSAQHACWTLLANFGDFCPGFFDKTFLKCFQRRNIPFLLSLFSLLKNYEKHFFHMKLFSLSFISEIYQGFAIKRKCKYSKLKTHK